MVVETATKGVLHDDHAQAHPVPGPRPLLDHSGAQRWQIMLEVAMGVEDWPEDIGHGEDDADEGHIRQRGPLVPLPESRAAITAAGATLRFASVVGDLLFDRGGVDLSTQGRCAAGTNLVEVGPYGVALGGAVPLVLGQFEDSPQAVFRVSLLGRPACQLPSSLTNPFVAPLPACWIEPSPLTKAQAPGP